MAKKRKVRKEDFVDEDGGIHLGTDFVDAYHKEVERLEKETPKMIEEMQRMCPGLFDDFDDDEED